MIEHPPDSRVVRAGPSIGRAYRIVLDVILVLLFAIILISLLWDESETAKTIFGIVLTLSALVFLSIPVAMYVTGRGLILSHGDVTRWDQPRRYWSIFTIVVVIDFFVLIAVITWLFGRGIPI